MNASRRNKGLGIATHVWLWGAGQRPAFESFKSKYGVQATMITGVDLLRGLAALAGWRCREVKGATGYLDTDYAAKGQAAIDELRTSDLVCVHVEAPDEAGHEGNASAKVKALEEIDEKIVSPVIGLRWRLRCRFRSHFKLQSTMSLRSRHVDARISIVGRYRCRSCCRGRSDGL